MPVAMRQKELVDLFHDQNMGGYPKYRGAPNDPSQINEKLHSKAVGFTPMELNLGKPKKKCINKSLAKSI